MAHSQGKISKLFGGRKLKHSSLPESPLPARGPMGRPETKPKVKEVIVTYNTEENLFRLLKPKLELELSKLSFVDEKYKDGNASLLTCKVKFEKFAPQSFEKLDSSFFNHNKFLFGTPLIHLFFTSCNEISWYNRNTKNDIQTWLMALEEVGFDNWLLVHVTQHASTIRKNALNNINSVTLAIKEDFSSVPSREKKFYQLTLPEKGDQTTEKHYKEFITYLFGHMNQCFIQHTDHYETLLSMTREDQDKPLWNFFHYYLMQEQLCFAYEHMGMHQAALLAYDELDVMLHFLVLKMSYNKVKKSRWFETLQQCCQEVLLDYPHITLSLDQSHDPSMLSRTCSIFKLRSVIFERQATLLFILGQAWDVGQRALKLLKDLSEESAAMKLPLSVGVIDAWSYLMCKNVLDVILDQLSNNPVSNLKQFAIELRPDSEDELGGGPDRKGPSQWVVRAQLWHLQLNKLHTLGQISGFIRKEVDTCSLSEDIGQTDTVKELWGAMAGSDHSVCSLELLNVLTSRDSFNRIYVELAEQLIGALKHAGRKRMAMHASMNFARFLLTKRDLAKAQDVLTEACKLYHSDKWPVLRLNSLTLLAASQDTRDNPPHEYLTTCALLSCTPPILGSHSQLNFFEGFRQKVRELEAGQEHDLVQIQFSLMFAINAIQCEKVEWQAGDVIPLTLSLTSKAPADILINCVKLVFQGKESLMSPIANVAGYWTRTYSFSPIDEEADSPPHPQTQPPEEKVLFRQTSLAQRFTEKLAESQKGSKDKSEKFRSSRSMSRTHLQNSSNFDFYFSASEVLLKPGANELKLSTKCKTPGSYRADDLLLDFACVEFRHSADPGRKSKFPEAEIEVVPTEAKASLSVECPGGFLLAGKPTEVTLNIFNEGKTIILCGSKIMLTGSQMLLLKVLTGQFENEGEQYVIVLPDVKAGGTYEVKLQVQCDPEALKLEGSSVSLLHFPVREGQTVTASSRLPSEVELPKDSLYTLNPGREEESSCGCVLQLTARCNWISRTHHDYGAVIPLVFYMPFHCRYSLHSSGDLSFVKLTVQSTAPLPIFLKDMKVKQTNLLKSLSGGEVQCQLNPGDTRVLLYQVDKEFNPVLSQICQLLIHYSMVGQEDTGLEHSFRFRLSDVQTMFILTSQLELSGVSPKQNQETTLVVNIKNVRDLPRQWQAPVDDIVEVEYRLGCEDGTWELGKGVEGALKLQPMKNASQDLTFKIRPLKHGQLVLPEIHLTLKSYTWNKTSSYIMAQFTESSSPEEVPYNMTALSKVQAYNSCASMIVPIQPQN